MSLDKLPDELLLEIIESCVDLFHVADEFYSGENPCPPPSHGLVWCKYWRIAPLSVVNTRMRRVCLPILFSCIFLEYTRTDLHQYINLIIDPAVELLFHAVRERTTEIAQHIRVIRAIETECADCLTCDVAEMFCAMLPVLPNLTSIDMPPLRATHAFVSAANNHPNLRVVDVPGCPRVETSNVLPARRGDFLSRIRLRDLEAEGDRAVDFTTGRYVTGLREWLEMGMRIKKLHCLFTVDEPVATLLLQIPPSSVDQLAIFADKRTAEDFEAFTHSLDSWRRRWPSSSMPDIEFSGTLRSHALPPLCPNIRADNLDNIEYTVRASFVEARVQLGEYTALRTGAYHMPNVVCLQDMLLTPETIVSDIFYSRTRNLRFWPVGVHFLGNAGWHAWSPAASAVPLYLSRPLSATKIGKL